jgi:hypothetical protein
MSSYGRYQDKSRFEDVSGSLSANGDTITIPCEGTASAVVSIKGTFNGKIRAYGSAANSVSTEGGRIAFLSGVGSLGTDTITNTGDTWDSEFRFITGGNKFTLEAVDWVSGTVEIQMSVSNASSVVFINGPVHSAEEEATRSGRAFLSGTGVIPVTGTEAVFVKFENPSNSTHNLFLARRLFSANRTGTDAILEYRAYVNPTMVLSTVGPEINRRVGSPFAAQAIWSWQAADFTTITIGGTEGSGGFIPHLGVPEVRDLEVVIPPGESLGFVVTGQGNNIGQAARISIALEWYEEDYVI